MSLDERLYTEFWKKFEKDRTHHGKKSQEMYIFGKYARFITGAGILISGSYLMRKFVYEGDNAASAPDPVVTGLMIASAGLTVHMHDVKTIFHAMYRKNTGEEINEEEISKVKVAGKRGRYAHFGAATGIAASIVGLVPEDPLFLGLMPILPLWYYYTIFKGYGALYNAAVDYVAGKQRQFSK